MMRLARSAWSRLGSGYVKALFLVMLATAISLPLRGRIADSELVMIYFLAIVLAALRTGTGPALLAAAASVALFDLLFVPPYLTFRVHDVRHVLTFGMMLVVGLVIGTLTARLRSQATASDARERRKAALLALARDLTMAGTAAEVGDVTARHVREVVEGTVVLFGVTEGGAFEPLVGAGTLAAFDSDERNVARHAFEHGEPSGCGTTTRPDALGFYLPLSTAARRIGVLGILVDDENRVTDVDPRRLLTAMADLAALALERVRLADMGERAALKARTEELRNTLLSSVSHDLRTPLAAITGVATALLAKDALDAGERRELLLMVQEESDRLERLVANLLDMTRLASGGIRVRKEWLPLEEIVGSALRRFGPRLEGRVRVDIPSAALVPLDELLAENVLVNLLDNALRHTPVESVIEIRASVSPEEAVLEVGDEGTGIPEGSEEKLFEKFWQADGSRGRAGLGLPICRGILEAHGGRITALRRPEGGTLFRMVFPIDGGPPDVPVERRDAA